ncbi:TRNA pseudouridine synthase, partial [Penicillium alfredii]
KSAPQQRFDFAGGRFNALLSDFAAEPGWDLYEAQQFNIIFISPQTPKYTFPACFHPVFLERPSTSRRIITSLKPGTMAGDKGRGGGAGEKRRPRDLGRGEWSRQNIDKRARHEQQAEAKRRKIENGDEPQDPIYATQFSKEEIDNEERRPKKKAAVLLGYSGTGYSGMQLNVNRKTIEGDLFAAFVAAGAISKANAADPKKSSFVRCARTDKGVHAAGNVVSLKMIVEDPDIVQKINEKLSPQIRVWGIELTSKSFSCYQLCDSRVYEYLMPSHCLLPPHPSTYLGRKIVESAEQAGETDALAARQEEVAGFWEEIDEKHIKPILENVPEDVRQVIQKALYWKENQEAPEGAEDASAVAPEPNEQPPTEQSTETSEGQPDQMDPRQQLIHDTIKSIKAAYNAAKRNYRVPTSRITRLQECLNQYEGTKNFHNYTIQKTHRDPSSKRHIKSFNVNPTPIVINGTEWLSLKVHGQSFMMHQIRKMVAMAALVVRSGCPPARINETYGPDRIAIPKAPGLGLLLERPIFDGYNVKASSLGREHIDFSKFSKEMDEFKQREIYDRIFREEDETHAFASFFNHIDSYPVEYFLYVTAGGISTAKLVTAPGSSKPSSTAQSGNSQQEALAAVEAESEDEANPPDGGEEGG